MEKQEKTAGKTHKGKRSKKNKSLNMPEGGGWIGRSQPFEVIASLRRKSRFFQNHKGICERGQGTLRDVGWTKKKQLRLMSGKEILP